MILTSLELDHEGFARHTGWTLKPEGACKGDVCVPIPADERTDAVAVAARLGMAVVADEARGLWALGPATATGRALTSAEAPDLVLPDLGGNDFALSSLRGSKIFLLAWASW